MVIIDRVRRLLTFVGENWGKFVYLSGKLRKFENDLKNPPKVFSLIYSIRSKIRIVGSCGVISGCDNSNKREVEMVWSRPISPANPSMRFVSGKL